VRSSPIPSYAVFLSDYKLAAGKLPIRQRSS
jgi:hypothetical protein